MPTKTNEPITLEALPAGSVVELQGKQYPTVAGLLAVAHAHGLESMSSDLLNYADGKAIIKATATGTRGTFEAHGDASPEDTQNPAIRMAETRAHGRCLRLYLGIGTTTREELPPESFRGRSGGNTRTAPQKTAPRKQSPAVSAAAAVVGVPTECPKCDGRIWDNQKRKREEPTWRGPWFSCRDKDSCGWVMWEAPAPQSTPEPEPVSDDEIPF